jgi:RNA polymerase sigma factor (sigma-70 family)
MSVTILLADDHPIVRAGLRLILETERNFKVINEVENGQEAVRHAVIHQPQIVIMDITMPELNGIEATRQIRKFCAATQVIILSMHASTEHIFLALEAGANGYLLKGSASDEIVPAVERVRLGRRYLSQKLPKEILEEYQRRQKRDEIRNPLAPLSSREREVFQLVVEGKSSAEIAERLFLSIKTVETYRHRLMRKLNISDIPTLVKFAIQHRLTPLE